MPSGAIHPNISCGRPSAGTWRRSRTWQYHPRTRRWPELARRGVNVPAWRTSWNSGPQEALSASDHAEIGWLGVLRSMDGDVKHRASGRERLQADSAISEQIAGIAMRTTADGRDEEAIVSLRSFSLIRAMRQFMLFRERRSSAATRQQRRRAASHAAAPSIDDGAPAPRLGRGPPPDGAPTARWRIDVDPGPIASLAHLVVDAEHGWADQDNEQRRQNEHDHRHGQCRGEAGGLFLGLEHALLAELG